VANTNGVGRSHSAQPRPQVMGNSKAEPEVEQQQSSNTYKSYPFGAVSKGVNGNVEKIRQSFNRKDEPVPTSSSETPTRQSEEKLQCGEKVWKTAATARKSHTPQTAGNKKSSNGGLVKAVPARVIAADDADDMDRLFDEEMMRAGIKFNINLSAEDERQLLEIVRRCD